jgi:hypothetical protein
LKQTKRRKNGSAKIPNGETEDGAVVEAALAQGEATAGAVDVDVTIDSHSRAVDEAASVAGAIVSVVGAIDPGRRLAITMTVVVDPRLAAVLGIPTIRVLVQEVAVLTELVDDRGAVRARRDPARHARAQGA